MKSLLKTCHPLQQVGCFKPLTPCWKHLAHSGAGLLLPFGDDGLDQDTKHSIDVCGYLTAITTCNGKSDHYVG